MVLSFDEYTQQLQAQLQEISNEKAKLLRDKEAREKILYEKVKSFTASQFKKDTSNDAVGALCGEITQLRLIKDYFESAITIESFKERVNALINGSLISSQSFMPVMHELSSLCQRNSDGGFEKVPFPSLREHRIKMVDWTRCVLRDRLKQYQSTLPSCLPYQLLCRQLRDQLTVIGWPKPISPADWTNQEVEAMLETFDMLTMLGEGKCTDAMDVLMEPIIVAFKFHFDSDRPTARLDKPEWYLAHVGRLLSSHLPFFTIALGSDDQDGAISEDIASLFASQLEKLLESHLKERLSRIKENSALLMHTIQQYRYFITALPPSVNMMSLLMLMCDEEWIDLERTKLEQSIDGLFTKFSPLWIMEGEGFTDNPKIIEAILSILEDQLKTLYTLPSSELRASFLMQVVFVLLKSLFDRMDFDVPPFYDTQEDIRTLSVMANSLVHVMQKLTDLGESLQAIDLSQEEAVVNALEYDASGLRGSIFNEYIEAFDQLQSRLLTTLDQYAWNAFSSHAVSYARAMHYGVLREGFSGDGTEGEKFIGMHDDLRAALVAMSQVMHSLKDLLHPDLLPTHIYPAMLKSLNTFLLDRVLWQNFYNKPGVDQFVSDLKTIQNTFASLLPDQPIRMAMQKTLDGASLLKALVAGDETSLALRRALSLDDYEEVVTLLNQLNISHLSLSECEQLMSLLR